MSFRIHVIYYNKSKITKQSLFVLVTTMPWQYKTKLLPLAKWSCKYMWSHVENVSFFVVAPFFKINYK